MDPLVMLHGPLGALDPALRNAIEFHISTLTQMNF